MIEMVWKETISCEEPPIRYRSKNIVKEKRKRVTVALSVVLAFKNSDLNSNSSSRTNILSSFTCGSMFIHIWNPC